MKKFLYVVLMTVCICTFFISAFMLLRYYFEYKQSENGFESIEELVVSDKPEVKNSAKKDSKQAEKSISAAEKYGEIYKKNNDFAGWISIENTRVNYPVMQTKDRPDYYLKRNFEKAKDKHGVPYIDERCDIDTSDNIIIYGHNMRDGTMFAAVGKYKNEDYWKEHKIINFDTLKEYGEYEIISAFKVSVSAENSFKYYNFINARNEDEFNYFITRCKKLSLYDTGVTAQYGDRLITLSTCEYSKEDGRFVVVAKKVK